MILSYHKVDLISPTKWWVKSSTFQRQIESLSNRRFVFLDDHDPHDPSQVVLTFDDGYANLGRHAFPLLAEMGYPFEVFVIGNRIGGWNHFDRDEPLTPFFSLDELAKVVELGGRIQWHSQTHPVLTRCSAAERERELTIPASLQQRFASPHLRWFAYPYGLHDAPLVEQVRSRFAGALSVDHPSHTDRHCLPRYIVTEQTSFATRS